MYGILAHNRGMWGMTVWCVKDGKPELFATMEEAQKVAKERNDRQIINRFTDYYVADFEKEEKSYIY